MRERTYHDPLHGGIRLNSEDKAELMVMELIETPPFQRLRRIRQLGPAFLTFHGAESSRFTHSLGVFHLTRRALERLVKFDPNLNQYRGILYGAALLHDIGHSPLSHTGEELFGLCHEKWSAQIIREHPSIKRILENYSENTSNDIADIIELNKSPHYAIKSLISSQLDCDRLDYLMRDSYSTGTNYGQIDLERILSALTLAPDGDLAIHPKGLMAVEHYLVTRNLMYRSVYNHRINEVCTWLLDQLIKNVRKFSPKQVWADNCMHKWLWEPDEINLEIFLDNDDLRTGYHLLRWKEDGPENISILCKRFLNRNLLKAINIENLENELQLEALSIARRISEKIGQDPNISCGLRHQKFDGYKPYRSGLRLWDGNQLSALEKSSQLVNTLIASEAAAWLIHPKEIHEELKTELKFLAESTCSQN